MMNWQTHQESSGYPLLSGQSERCRRGKTRPLTSIFVVSIFALVCETVKRSVFTARALCPQKH